MPPDRRPSPTWRRPDAEPEDFAEATRTFTEADLAALRALLVEDRRRAPKPSRPVRRGTPNLGPWLAMVVIVTVLAATALTGFVLWLYYR